MCQCARSEVTNKWEPRRWRSITFGILDHVSVVDVIISVTYLFCGWQVEEKIRLNQSLGWLVEEGEVTVYVLVEPDDLQLWLIANFLLCVVLAIDVIKLDVIHLALYAINADYFCVWECIDVLLCVVLFSLYVMRRLSRTQVKIVRCNVSAGGNQANHSKTNQYQEPRGIYGER